MASVLTIRTTSGDLLPICGDGEGIGKLPKYFRFTGPIVKRALAAAPDDQKLFVVEYGNGVTNRKIRNIFQLEKDGMMTTGQDFLIKIISAGAPSPLSIKNELSAHPAARNLPQVFGLMYSSLFVTGTPVLSPADFSFDHAKELVDILAKDGTVAVVVNKAKRDVPVYGADVVMAPKAAAVAPAALVVDDKYFYLEPDVATSANILFSMFSDPNYKGVNTLILSGPSGYGKTAFCAVLAEKLGMELVNFDMSLVLETEEVMGHRAIEGGSTKFQLNEFAEKVQAGNVIIVLDELNRTFAGALNALFPFLDHRRGNNFQGQRIAVGERVIFVGTRNVGTGYVGTHQSDDALLRRFEFAANVGSIPKEEEVKLLVARTACPKNVAQVIAKVAASIRESDAGVNCPPATTLLVAKMATFGVNPRVTFQLNLVNKLEDIELRRAVEEFLNRGFGMTFEEGMANSTFSKAF